MLIIKIIAIAQITRISFFKCFINPTSFQTHLRILQELKIESLTPGRPNPFHTNTEFRINLYSRCVGFVFFVADGEVIHLFVEDDVEWRVSKAKKRSTIASRYIE